MANRNNNSCDLASCFLCRHSLPEWIDLVALRKQTIHFKKGETLYRECDPFKGIYFMLSGAVKVHKQWGAQKELTIRFASAGDVLGLRGIGGSTICTASATALDAGRACFVPMDFLEASMRTNAGLTMELFHYCAEELQRSEKRMSELAHMDVKGRIAGALLAAEEAFGTAGDGSIGIAISRQDIAAYAGTIYETVFKVFTEWINAGIISTEGKHMKLLDREKLLVLFQ